MFISGMTGAQIERAKAKRRGTANRAVLREDDYFHFIDILRDLTVDRESIKRAMGFALDNADAYEEVRDWTWEGTRGSIHVHVL